MCQVTITQYPPECPMAILEEVERLQAERPTGRKAIRDHRRQLADAMRRYNEATGIRAFSTSHYAET